MIDEAAHLGVRMVQFIGGEPTLHPSLSSFVHHARNRDLDVEVFSNLVHVPRSLWDVFSRHRVRLATSYYSDQEDQHERITARRRGHMKTIANIAEAVRRSIPLRVGLIDVMDGQRTSHAREQLEELGVTEISTDRLRHVGRGVRDRHPDISQLCGACGRDKVAVASNGEVWPCVFSRWMPMGNVRSKPLTEIVALPKMREIWRRLGYDESTRTVPKCGPDSRCEPLKSGCQPNCPPGYHSDPKKCWPYYYEERRR